MVDDRNEFLERTAMNVQTLESLARRVEALEKDWRRVVGMFGHGEFMREVDEESLRSRDAARRGDLDE